MRYEMDEDKKRVANLLRRFVRGDTEEWEFDDFLSSKFEQPQLEMFRRELADLPLRYPPTLPLHYTSEDGVLRIIEIANELEETA